MQQPTPGRKQILSPVNLASTSEEDVLCLMRLVFSLQNWKKKSIAKSLCKDTGELWKQQSYINRIPEREEPVRGELWTFSFLQARDAFGHGLRTGCGSGRRMLLREREMIRAFGGHIQ